jgi:hypothetical protein
MLPLLATSFQTHLLTSLRRFRFSKYARVVLTKLVPHVDLLLKRMQWADNDTKCLVPFVVACLLTHIVDSNYTNTTPKLAFLTSPRHFLIEVVELDLMPFLHSREEALVFEAARSIIFVSQRSDAMKPSWIFAVCRSMMGLMSRDSCRSVATRAVSMLLDGVELLPASLLLGVCIRVFQQLSLLNLSSSRTFTSQHGCATSLALTLVVFPDMRLYFVQRLMNTLVKQSIKEQTRQQGGSPIGVAGKLFDDLIKSSWMQGMLDHNDEDSFCEEIMACMMRAVAQTFLEAASSLTEAVDSGVSSGELNDAKEAYREWRQILISLTAACAKCCGWKTHLRTYLHESYIKLVDTAGFALQSPSKRDRDRLTELLNGIADHILSLKHESLCLRLIFVLLKHSPPVVDVRKLLDTVHSVLQTRFLGVALPAQSAADGAKDAAASPASQPVAARQLGYRVDQMKKSQMSPTDTETLYLCLAMEAAHPASDVADPSRRHNVTLQMKFLSSTRVQLDPALAQRMNSILTQVTSASTPSTEILPISRQIFYPPLEYMDKNIVERVPDDDFVINFSRAKHKLDSRLSKVAEANGDDRVASVLGVGLLQNVSLKKRAAAVKPVASSERIHSLTSPSDPFLVTARFEVTDDRRLKIHFQLTNLTRFAVPKLVLQVNIAGRLDISSDSAASLEFENIAPSKHLETSTTMRILSFSSNIISARVILVPSADKPNTTLEINCVPQRLNMHELIRPWVLDNAEFLKQWSRVSTTFQFKAFVSEGVLVRTLNEKLAPFYNCVLHWNYAGDTFYSEAFAGLTLWDESVLFTVNGTMTELGGVVLRFEIRASSLNLSVILDTHKEQWLNDLFGENIRLLEDANLAGESAKTLFDVTRPSLSKREYNDEKLLQSWADIRRGAPF